MSEKKATITQIEYRRIRRACRGLPPPRGNYHVQDYVENLLLTVLDYRLGTAIVTKAHEHFRRSHGDRLRCYGDLIAFLAEFPDTLQGNVDAAVALWGYKYGSRLAQLRKLAGFLTSIGVTDQPSLVQWAQGKDYKQHFAGKVKGLGFAVYQCLLLRVGVETVKPDVHVLAFLRAALKRSVNERETVSVLERVAKECGLQAHELDWAIWEYQRSKQRVVKRKKVRGRRLS